MEPDRVTLLLGNHMMHYVGLSDDTCRLDWNNIEEIYNLMREHQPLFQHALRWKNTLFTHAGVTEGWLQQSKYTTDPNLIAEELNKDIEFTNELTTDPRGDISFWRGGYQDYGSPSWADLKEMYNGSAFKKNLIQIFGHTQLRETGSFYHKDNFYCCDSREVFIWNSKDLKVFK